MGACQCIEHGFTHGGNNNNEVYSEKYSKQREQSHDFSEDALFLKTSSQQKTTFHDYNKNLVKAVTKEIEPSNMDSISLTASEINSCDYYEQAKLVFDMINFIRINPENYLRTLNKIAKELELRKLGEKTINQNQTEENNYQKQNTYHSRLQSEMLDFESLINYADDQNLVENFQTMKANFEQILKDKNSAPIIWSEKVYNVIYENFIQTENNITGSHKFYNNKGSNNSDNKDYSNNLTSSSQKVSEKLKGRMECIEFLQIGRFQPEVSVLSLLIENTQRLKEILVDNYSCAAVCSYQLKHNNEVRTVFYFVDRDRTRVKLRRDPLSSSDIFELYLDNPLFNNIDYKSLIKEGCFISSSNKLSVTFILNDNSTKEEIYDLSQPDTLTQTSSIQQDV